MNNFTQLMEPFLKKIDLENLGFDMGAHLLVKFGLQQIPIGSELEVTGQVPQWTTQLAAWCRVQGHGFRTSIGGEQESAFVLRRSADSVRWTDLPSTGGLDPTAHEAVKEKANASWGLAARGAKVEAGGPSFYFRLDQKVDVWSDNITELYNQAANAQWNPDQAIDWNIPQNHEKYLEDAIVQVMTYLVENENAALIIPARFLGQLHPHFREVQALLAIQIADESRHIQVFSRRISLYGQAPALSTAGGQASLKTLLDEPDFSVAGFLLSVLGEGTFVDLLQFLALYGPDPVTRQIAHLTARDESRHVSFGMSHLLQKIRQDAHLLPKLKQAIQDRHDGLANTNGLNAEVFDALILIAAGSYRTKDLAVGMARVQSLLREMSDGRRTRLIRLGFDATEAQYLSSLHTRNFM